MKGACLVLAMSVGVTVGCARPQTAEPEVTEPREDTRGSSEEMLTRVYRLLVHRQPEEALALLEEHVKADPSEQVGRSNRLMLVTLCAAGRDEDAIAMAAEMGAEAAKAAQARREAAQARREAAAGEPPVHAEPFEFELLEWEDLLEHNEATDCARRVEAEHERQLRRDRTARRREGVSPGGCPAELEAMDTVLFRGRVSIRVPKNVALVEEGAFFAVAKTPTVSACDAMIDKMAVILLEEIEPNEDLGAKGKKLLEKNGFTNGVFAPPEVTEAHEHRQVVEVPGAGNTPPVTVYMVLQRYAGLQAVVWYLAQPDQLPRLIDSFRASADHLVVRR